jgi:hypothetical protein
LEKTDPFNELSNADQKVAIDAAIALILLGTRMPAVGQPLYDYVTTEFVSCYHVPANLAKYAMRSLAKALMAQDWTLTISKTGSQITTKFTPQPIGGSNSQEWGN